MKKFLFLLTVLGCLVLSSGVLAESIPNHYCLVDDYGCYVIDDENHSSYLMFWSEEGRRAVMGELTAPYENVVDKPGADVIVDNNLFPLFVPTAPATPVPCNRSTFVAAYCNIFFPDNKNCTEDDLPTKYSTGNFIDSGGTDCIFEVDKLIIKFCESPESYSVEKDIDNLERDHTVCSA